MGLTDWLGMGKDPVLEHLLQAHGLAKSKHARHGRCWEGSAHGHALRIVPAQRLTAHRAGLLLELGECGAESGFVLEAVANAMPAPAPEAAGAAGHPLDALIHERIQDIGAENFPDNADVRWRVLGIEYKGAYAFVEADALPATAGYPKFRFVLRDAQDGTLRNAACYIPGNTGWKLLCTDPAEPDDWRRYSC